MTIQAVGVVGLGVIGGGIARNLARAGRRTVVYDRREEAVRSLVEAGAVSVPSPAGLAMSDVSHILIAVENERQTEQVLFGENGLSGALAPGHCIVAHSTMSPDYVMTVAERLSAIGVDYLDCPVSGGSDRASAGELTLFVGGEEPVLSRARSVLDTFASHVFHVGPIAAGTQVKLINNMMMQTNTVTAIEALSLAKRLDLDVLALIEVISVSTGDSFAFRFRAPRVADGNYTPGGTIDINFKDQELVTAMAKKAGAPLFMANISQQIFGIAQNMGYGRQDPAVLIEIYDRLGERN